MRAPDILRHPIPKPQGPWARKKYETEKRCQEPAESPALTTDLRCLVVAGLVGKSGPKRLGKLFIAKRF